MTTDTKQAYAALVKAVTAYHDLERAGSSQGEWAEYERLKALVPVLMAEALAAAQVQND